MLKITGDKSIILSNETVKAICSGSSNPRANTLVTNQGAANQHVRDTNPRITRTRFATDEARRQAPEWSSRVRKPVNVGRKAEANAPPAIRLKRVSGSRLAAKKASRSPLVPKAREIRIELAKPVRLEATKPIITTLAARTIW